MGNAIGWAVLKGTGRVLIRTVSDTRRAAIVNFLVSECQQMVTSMHTDEDIENMWGHYGKYSLVSPVAITPTELSLQEGKADG